MTREADSHGKHARTKSFVGGMWTNVVLVATRDTVPASTADALAPAVRVCNHDAQP